jgi:hypothetical protein
MNGSGTSASPYIITTLAELQSISSSFSYYALGNDIDGANIAINPITYFYGNLDGQGYTIKNLIINQSGTNNYTALFGTSAGSSYNQCIKNLNLTNITVNPSGSGSYYYVSILIAYTGSKMSISNVHVSNCIITGYVGSYVGALIGYQNSTTANISSCTADNVPMYGCYTGGLVGCCTFLSISSSSTSGNIYTPTVSSTWYFGGLVGYVYSASSNFININNCYSKINFLKTSGSTYILSSIGGMVAYGNSYSNGLSLITNSYFAGQIASSTYNNCYGLITNYASYMTIKNSYMDSTLASLVTVTYGTPKTTVQMKDFTNYIGWGFPWAIDNTGAINGGYPYFNPDVTNIPFVASVITNTLNGTLATKITASSSCGLLYNFAESLPSGITGVGFGSMSDPTGNNKGNVLSNYGHSNNNIYNLNIPITVSSNCSLVVEYYASCDSSSTCSIIQDSTYMLQTYGYTIGVASYSNNNSGTKPQTIYTGMWSTFEFPVTSGNHTLKFQYQKGSSATQGLDGFVIGKIYLKETQVNIDKSSYSDIMKFYPSTIKAKISGYGKQDVNINATIMTSNANVTKPHMYLLKDNILNFQSGSLPTGSTTSYYTVGADPTSSSKGNVLYSTNKNLSSTTAYANIPLTFASSSSLSIDYYISGESGYDKLSLILDGTANLVVSGSGGGTANIATNLDTTTNPNASIKSNTWLTYTIKNVASGNHTLKVQYYKDGSGNYGLDLGAVSQIVYKTPIFNADTDFNCNVGVVYSYVRFYQLPYGDNEYPPVIVNNVNMQQHELVMKSFYLERKIDDGNWQTYKYFLYSISNFKDVKDLKANHTYQYRITDLSKATRTAFTSDPLIYTGIENSFNEVGLIDTLTLNTYSNIFVSGNANMNVPTAIINTVFKSPATRIINNLMEIFATKFTANLSELNSSVNIHYIARPSKTTETISAGVHNKISISIYRQQKMCNILVLPQRVKLLDASKMGSANTQTLSVGFRPPTLTIPVQIKPRTQFIMPSINNNIGLASTVVFSPLTVIYNEDGTTATVSCTINYMPPVSEILDYGFDIWATEDEINCFTPYQSWKNISLGSKDGSYPCIMTTVVDLSILLTNQNPYEHPDFDDVGCNTIRSYVVINGNKYYSGGWITQLPSPTNIVYTSNAIDAYGDLNTSASVTIKMPKSNGNSSDCGVCWSADNMYPTVSDRSVSCGNVVHQIGTGLYTYKTATLTGIPYGEIFYYRAYVFTNGQYAYSSSHIFKGGDGFVSANLGLLLNEGDNNIGFIWWVSGLTVPFYDIDNITSIVLKVEELYTDNGRAIIRNIPVPARGNVDPLCGVFREVYPDTQYRVTLIIKLKYQNKVVISEDIYIPQPNQSEVVYV